MFQNAAAFNQDLNVWGDTIQSTAVVTGAFSGTACQTTADPELLVAPYGPFCSYLSCFPNRTILDAALADSGTFATAEYVSQT